MTVVNQTPQIIKRGVKDPFDKDRPFKKQAEYISWARGLKKRNDEYVYAKIAAGANPMSDWRPIQYGHYVGGRGSSKTTTGVIVLGEVALVHAPGFRTFWSSRTDGEIESVFLRELEKVYPTELGLWKHVRKRSAQWIEWASGHVTDLVSRNVDNPKKRPALGFNVMGGLHDEAATAYLKSKFDDIENAIREPDAPFLFCGSLSTPLENGYEVYVYQSNSKIVFSSSWQNPYLSKSMLDQRAAVMDKRTMDQELGGKFQRSDGLMWPDFEFEQWPKGNLIPDDEFEFDADKPFYVSSDLGGNQGSYQLYQYIDPLHPITGEKMFDGKLAVCFAEYVPNRIDLPAITSDIEENYGRPEEVFTGHDVSTRGNTGDSASLHFAQIGWKYSHPSGPLVRKDVQKMALRSLILNTRGERRLAIVAKQDDRGLWHHAKQIHGDGKQRGLINVMRRDAYAEDTSDDIFVKDKKTKGKNAIEDDRDACLYWAVCAHPPKWIKSELRSDR
jgi:hypothetical protein